MKFWSPLEELNAEVIAEGGFVNAHSHLDRAYTVSPKMMARTKEHLFEKWELVDEIKKTKSVEKYAQGITTALDMQAWYGVSHVCSFIDIDEVVGHRALDGAIIAKNNFDAVKLIIACQTLKGVIDPNSFGLIESRIDDIDIVGSLPGADKGRESEHLDIVMKLAKRSDKMLHVHVDQLNTPDEKETELLCRKTIEHGLEGKVVAVHSISLAAHQKNYRNEVYRMAKDAGMMFITCPSAWIDHPRTERLVPFHNAVTPVDELLENDLVVAIGSDNICDIYKPYSDGDISVEMRFLLESCKIYDMPTLKKISRENGLKVCNA
jgi:cytosine/adenosine deaminase-related metal-dependent hydrolase